MKKKDRNQKSNGELDEINLNMSVTLGIIMYKTRLYTTKLEKNKNKK